MGRRAATQRFNNEIVALFQKHWSALDQPSESVTFDQVTEFAKAISHMCPSRWNTALTALRFITDKAGMLKRRKLRFRQFNPPNQLQFSALLAECDKLPRSKATGQIIRFLCLTGLRIGEARSLTWDSVGEDYIEVSRDNSKNGRCRRIPFLPGTKTVLERLRELGDGHKVLPTRNVRNSLIKACRLAGVPRLSFHCLRHIWITRCIEFGTDLPTLARWAGHADGGSLLARTYFHLVDDHSRRMAEKVRIAI
jgi:integrase